jgi:glycosyltransferase involved in cell wall biosynthesis
VEIRTDMTSRRPHLLYVAWGYPPCRGGGVYRALATANAFARSGWDVTVLTVEREVFESYTGVDASLEAHVDPSIDVVRIPFTLTAHETDLTRYSWTRANLPGVWAIAHRRRDTFRFPEPNYGSWRTGLELAAEDIHRRRPVDLVVATANPHVAFAAARRLNKIAGVPYVMDYRDAWLLDVFTGGRLHAVGSRAARWEAGLVARAHEVWFVNEPIKAWHQELYPPYADRMHVVANGYDDGLAPDQPPELPDPDRPLTFGYIGTVSPRVPLAEFVAGWRRARADSPDLRDARAVIRGYLGYFLTPRPDLMAIVDGAGDVGVQFGGPVSKTEVKDVYEHFDVLLLLLGAGRYVTSGKVFEYVATGLPIVSVHDPGNAANDVLRGYPLWFPVATLSAQDIAAQLAAAARAAHTVDEATRLACRDFGERYSRERQLSPRIAALRAAVDPTVRAPAEVAS